MDKYPMHLDRLGWTLSFLFIKRLYALLRDPKVQTFLRMYEGWNRESYRHHRDQHILCAGIILPTMGINVNPDNYEG